MKTDPANFLPAQSVAFSYRSPNDDMLILMTAFSSKSKRLEDPAAVAAQLGRSKREVEQRFRFLAAKAAETGAPTAPCLSVRLWLPAGGAGERCRGCSRVADLPLLSAFRRGVLVRSGGAGRAVSRTGHQGGSFVPWSRRRGTKAERLSRGGGCSRR